MQRIIGKTSSSPGDAVMVLRTYKCHGGVASEMQPRHGNQYEQEALFYNIPFSSSSLVRSSRNGVMETYPFSTAQRSVSSSAGSSGDTVIQ